VTPIEDAGYSRILSTSVAPPRTTPRPSSAPGRSSPSTASRTWDCLVTAKMRAIGRPLETMALSLTGCQPCRMSLYRSPRRLRPTPPQSSTRVIKSVTQHRPTGRRQRQLHSRRSWNWAAIAALLAALAAAAGVIFTGLSLQATREQNAVIEQAQFTDRFTKAADQLDRTGDDHLQARLGAIYSLERLARDSPRDQPTIVEVLSAFVRSNASRSASAAASGCPYNVAHDIQTALTVLIRRDTVQDHGAYVDLRGTCLRRAILTSWGLERPHITKKEAVTVGLAGVGLYGANFTGSDLTDAELTGLNLTGARFSDADLTNAELQFTNLAGASLYDANLAGADLMKATHDDETVVYGALVDSYTVGKWWR
jgi:uncharacterized protein YjbI with pentapeptide repeats